MASKSGVVAKRRIGRPPASAGANTRRLIIEAAARQMAAVGYDAMSLEAIAVDAHITRPAIYRYFDSKRELAREVVLEQAPKLDAYFEEERVGAVSWTEKLQALLRACVRTVLEDPEMVVGYFQLGRLAASDPETARLFYARSARTRHILADLVDEGVHSGEIAADASRSAIVDALSGLILAVAAGVTEASTNEKVRRQILLAADLVLRQPDWLTTPVVGARPGGRRKRATDVDSSTAPGRRMETDAGVT
jgi:AcrR family transcriptional regulator